MQFIQIAYIFDITNNVSKTIYLQNEINKLRSIPVQVPLSITSIIDDLLNDQNLSMHIKQIAILTFFLTSLALFHNP